MVCRNNNRWDILDDYHCENLFSGHRLSHNFCDLLTNVINLFSGHRLSRRFCDLLTNVINLFSGHRLSHRFCDLLTNVISRVPPTHNSKPSVKRQLKLFSAWTGNTPAAPLLTLDARTGGRWKMKNRKLGIKMMCSCISMVYSHVTIHYSHVTKHNQ